MRGHAKSALPPAIAALATAVSVSVFSLSPLGNPASAAETCLGAPKSPPPAGQHWYYQTDRTLQRKCWYLAAKNGDRPSVKAEKPQAPPADEPVAPPTATPSVAEAPTRPEPQQQPTWITRNASETGSNATWMTQQPDRPADIIARADIPLRVPEPQAQAPSVPDTPAPDPQPVQQPLVIADVAAAGPAAAPEPQGSRTLEFALIVFGVIGILAGAVAGFIELRRRRGDVLNTAFQPDAAPLPTPVTVDRPTFAPLPPISEPRRRDDVDDALERFSQSRRRRAA